MSAEASYLQAETFEGISGNLAQVNHQIARACARVGRNPDSVRLLPVSKTRDATCIRFAYKAGCRSFGENKVQEAFGKWQNLSDLNDVRWSVIGHLQTNKAKYVARFASEFQALDSLKVARELDRRLQQEGRALNVFVQVNASGEASKYGLTPAAVHAFMKELPAFASLRIKGLMTLALFSKEESRVRNCFALLRELRNQLRQGVADPLNFNELSMGMSGDFEWAIEEGATVVRVGQAIFGARSLPDSHYWPSKDSSP